MSFANNKTGDLWRTFHPRQQEIKNQLDKNRYSMQIYPENFFNAFNPTVEFVKWAAVEVSDFNSIPADMEPIAIEGLYAVFLYKGAASQGREFFQYIFGTWLPQSEFLLDNRHHFEILGEKYKNEDPASEEEVWIPIKPKKA